MPQSIDGYAVVTKGSGLLYAYGATPQEATHAFDRQIAGAPRSMQAALRSSVRLLPLDADAASETAECIDAPFLGWGI